MQRLITITIRDTSHSQILVVFQVPPSKSQLLSRFFEFCPVARVSAIRGFRLSCFSVEQEAKVNFRTYSTFPNHFFVGEIQRWQRALDVHTRPPRHHFALCICISTNVNPRILLLYTSIKFACIYIAWLTFQTQVFVFRLCVLCCTADFLLNIQSQLSDKHVHRVARIPPILHLATGIGIPRETTRAMAITALETHLLLLLLLLDHDHRNV